MKKALFLLATVASTLLAPQSAFAQATAAQNAPQRIASVNFKKVIDNSKYGKQEQANFESLKKQMEAVLEGKEKTLTELAEKFNDQDYLDSLSEAAEEEMKDKIRTLSQELSQIQQQYYQSLNQANIKILQQLQDMVALAAEQAAKENGYDMVLSDEAGFYFSKSDISDKITLIMDDMFAKEKANKRASAPLN